MTKIEWTQRTWNPIVGCSIVSAGCKNCYAMRTAHRLERMHRGGKYAGVTELVGGKPVWNKTVRIHGDALEEPFRYRKPTWFFVSMSDLFHENLAFRDIARVLLTALAAERERGHAFQFLTKRPDRMLEYDGWASRFQCPVPRLCDFERSIFGVSVEDQRTADERLPILSAVNVRYRFASLEPLLEAVDVSRHLKWRSGPFPNAGIAQAYIDGLDWLIVGGETGPKARSMNPDWARCLRDQVTRSETAFFFKQHSGSKRNRLLDGRLWQEMPDDCGPLEIAE